VIITPAAAFIRCTVNGTLPQGHINLEYKQEVLHGCVY
jgi:hypothetical protein